MEFRLLKQGFAVYRVSWGSVQWFLARALTGSSRVQSGLAVRFRGSGLLEVRASDLGRGV